MSRIIEVSHNSRTMCDVLQEMRELVDSYKKISPNRDLSTLSSLIEEIQIMGNRMEAALWDQKRLEKLRQEIKKLEAKKDNLSSSS